ncbi:complement factor D-like [Cimex lectularius]|uniref:Peptidase S1 domain-containing protein n=1 Tax=Cimex lectularius TaxID=79782 RepID=A0A8I6TMM8_CIMLE|nr:complement factor D-like [Cimex lectularius]
MQSSISTLVFYLLLGLVFSQGVDCKQASKRKDRERRREEESSTEKANVTINNNKGRIPSYGDYPFVVSVETRSGRTHVCIGVLLSLTHVLSACHCFCSPNKSGSAILKKENYTVIAGLTTLRGKRSYQTRDVLNITVHPKCKTSHIDIGWENDCAVLRLVKIFSNTQYAQPIRIFSNMRDEVEEEFADLVTQGLKCSTLVRPVYGNVTIGMFEEIDMTSLTPYRCYRSLCLQRNLCAPHVLNIARDVCFTPVQNMGPVCGMNTASPLICGGFVWGMLKWAPSCNKTESPMLFSLLHSFMDFYAPFVSSAITKHFHFNVLLLILPLALLLSKIN